MHRIDRTLRSADRTGRTRVQPVLSLQKHDSVVPQLASAGVQCASSHKQVQPQDQLHRRWVVDSPGERGALFARAVGARCRRAA